MRRARQMISVLIGLRIRSVIGRISVASFLRDVDDIDFVILIVKIALLQSLFKVIMLAKCALIILELN